MIGKIELSLMPYYRDVKLSVVFGLNDTTIENRDSINAYLDTLLFHQSEKKVFLKGDVAPHNTNMTTSIGSFWNTICSKDYKLTPYVTMVDFEVMPYHLATLVHEIAHATFWVLDRVGVLISCDNDEAFTYFQQRLIEDFLEKFIAKKYKIIKL